ncbi:hypothetical protein NA57DRAFT_74717 [Rhizodiscina lignyota]|uniref:Uncharacterized protein n=1 Tax=Rhizodiscina lignyota TaxID=1504668 RepID=A0A9P4IN24_9PEZI|nr:hypothetical protein NA57DRAFT_74717 [Rhizodiscina lignyota]
MGRSNYMSLPFLYAFFFFPAFQCGEVPSQIITSPLDAFVGWTSEPSDGAWSQYYCNGGSVAQSGQTYACKNGGFFGLTCIGSKQVVEEYVGTATPFYGSTTQSVCTGLCQTALRYSDINDQSPLSAYGCWNDVFSIRSYYVNIPAATASTTSPITSSSTSASPSSIISTTSTPLSTFRTSTSSSSSSPLSVSSQPFSKSSSGSATPTIQASSSGLSSNKSNDIALGVGLGVGIPSFIVAVIGVVFTIRRARYDSSRNHA